MRQGQNNVKRSRGRGRKPQQHSANRSFDSNGPEVKIRGTAAHVCEKYQQLARDAISAGDRVTAENYYQHAEHYYRLLMATQQGQEGQQRQQTNLGYRPDEDEESETEFAPDGPQPRHPGQPWHQQDGNQSRDNQSRDNQSRDNQSRDNQSRGNQSRGGQSGNNGSGNNSQPDNRGEARSPGAGDSSDASERSSQPQARSEVQTGEQPDVQLDVPVKARPDAKADAQPIDQQRDPQGEPQGDPQGDPRGGEQSAEPGETAPPRRRPARRRRPRAETQARRYRRRVTGFHATHRRIGPHGHDVYAGPVAVPQTSSTSRSPGRMVPGEVTSA